MVVLIFDNKETDIWGIIQWGFVLHVVGGGGNILTPTPPSQAPHNFNVDDAFA